MSLIETIDLCQRFDEQDILKNINLRVDKGEVFALIGPTGAGKTTLLRLIGLLDSPSSGRIYFDGSDVTRSEKRKLEARRRMAFVLQKPIVFNMSVYDNIAYGLKWRGVRRSSLREKVSSVLEIVGLYTYQDRNARTLSGGEIQRVAIARAIAIEPELLILDEPTANLDPFSISRIEALITDIIHRYQTAIIMATHDLAQGQRLADRISVLVDGKILQTGSSRDIFAFPGNREVAEFVGVENVVDGVIVSNEDKVVTIDIMGKTISAISSYAVGEEVSACIRPEDITLSQSRITSSARNSFVAKITRIAPLNSLRRIEMDCGFPLTALVTKQSTEELEMKEGKQIYVTFKATGVHVIKRDGVR